MFPPLFIGVGPYYNCLFGSHQTHVYKVCDGTLDCPLGDDEWWLVCGFDGSKNFRMYFSLYFITVFTFGKDLYVPNALWCHKLKDALVQRQTKVTHHWFMCTRRLAPCLFPIK